MVGLEAAIPLRVRKRSLTIDFFNFKNVKRIKTLPTLWIKNKFIFLW